MAEKKKKVSKKIEKEAPFMYKDYDIRWLKGIGAEHPDFGLVAEYEEKYGEIK